ncbi:terminase small subunit-like protein [Pseudomonas sp. OTU750018]|uniref:terminase small subunit-like protein n=1 Tax=Pseudomonas sp. OTU750018 TaxID=2709708 RepID=UPI0019D5C474|nr:hypothetical protein [Pseudomonas sp. OTU750018]
MKTEQAAQKPATPKAKKKPVAQKAAGSTVRARNTAKTVGRPTVYSDLVAAKLCAYIADGMSLRNVCKQPGMPSTATVMRWLADDSKVAFRDQYAHAREAQADLLAEQILEIADYGLNDTYVDDEGQVKVDHDVIARSKLRVDARKWLASKMAPKKYGDKLQTELTGANGGAIAVNSTVTFVRPPERGEDDQ